MKLQISVLILLTVCAFNVFACEEEISKPEGSRNSEYILGSSCAQITARLGRFYLLDDLVSEQYSKGNYSKAKDLAHEYIELAETYSKNWNFGNAIHDANRILGLMSYSEGKIDEAADYLLQSSKSTGSPQLDTFGPEMDLANLLLKEGKAEAVKTYLIEIKKFWEMDNGAVDDWLEKIEAGKKPELNRFGFHRMTLWQKIINWLGILWPLIASMGVYVTFKDILIHWKFIPVSTIGAYVTMIAGGFFCNLTVVALIDALSVSLVTFTIVAMGVVFEFILPLVVIYWFSGRSFFAKNE